MAKQKACKVCNAIYEGEKCPKCGSNESTDTVKGRMYVLDPEKSEVAQKIGIKGKGEFAIKTK